MKEFYAIFQEKGLRTFLWVWAGQLVSIFGTAMTRFAMMIWAYQQTGSAATLALLGTANYIPYLALSPFAGVIVDRFDRRKIMLVADTLAGLMTAGLAALFITGRLSVAHLFIAEALTGAFEAFQIPAYFAAVSLLVPKSQIHRTNGLRSLARSASSVLAPLMAGGILAWVGMGAILAFDLASFLFSAVVLLLIRVPRPAQSEAGNANRGRFFEEMRAGFQFIFQRRGLRDLMLVMFGMNVAASLTYFSILPAMILARSGQNEWTLGIVQSVLGIGSLIGAFLVSTWGGPRRHVYSILFGGALAFLLGDLLFAVGRDVWFWAAAAFFSTLFIPFITSGQQSIWQIKTAPELQGRVFTVKDTLQMLMMPVGYAVGGLLADFVFEPAMESGGWLTGSMGWLVGVGPGAGMGVMFLFTWVAGTLLCLAGYLSPALRNVERDLPDAV